MKYSDVNNPADLSDYIKDPISTTQSGLQTLINNSSLQAGQWYLITDYQTVKSVLGTSTIYTGAVEQIYVQANDINKITPQGFSKTYPGEIIWFNSDVITYTTSGLAEYDDGSNAYDPFAVTTQTSTTFSVSGGTLPASSTWTAFYMYIEDYDDGGDFEVGLGDLGTKWTFDVATQTFTIIGAVDVDLTNAVWIEFDVTYPTGVTADGIITARYRPENELYVQDDYRGVKARRYKSNATTWTAGSVSANQCRKYGGYLWIAIVTTTATPSTSSTDWARLMIDDYVFPYTYFRVKSTNIPIDSTDYEDKFLFDVADLDSTVLNVNLLSNTSGDTNIVFTGDITNSRNSDLRNFTYGATITDRAQESDMGFDNAIINAVYRTELGSMYNSYIKYGYDSKGKQMRNSTFYYIKSCNWDYMSSVLTRTTFEKNELSYISSCIFMNVATTNSFGYSYNNTFYGTVYSNSAREFYSNTFKDHFDYNFIASSFYSNTFNDDCIRNTFMGKVYTNTFNYVADNNFMGNVTLNTINGTSCNINNNTIFGAFGNSSATHTNFKISDNTFGSYVDNDGDGYATITDNYFTGEFKGCNFNNGGSLAFSGNTGFSFGGTGTQGADFCMNGDAWVNNNFFGGQVKYLNVDSGAQIIGNSFLGTTSTFDCKNSGVFNYNEVGTAFDINTLDGVTVTKNKFPPYYQSTTLVDLTDTQITNTLDIKTALKLDSQTITNVSTGTADNDKIVTQGYVDDANDTQDTAIALNTTHRTSNGTDHSYIDQDVTTTGTPTFGVTTLGDSSQLATSAAPTADADIANKKYVDDAITSGTSSFIDGSGTTDYVAKWSDSDTIANSIIRDDGSSIGINTSPNAYIMLNVVDDTGYSNDLSTASYLRTILNAQDVYSTSANTSVSVTGINGVSSLDSDYNYTGDYIGSSYGMSYSGDATVTTIKGMAVSAGLSGMSGTGTITNCYGLDITPEGYYSGTGTITNFYGLRIANFSDTKPTVTNYYGIYQEDSTATNYLAGKLDLNGDFDFDGNNFASVSTGTGDNDKLPTQGYVDDLVSALSSDKINEGDSKVEVVDTGTGYITHVVDGTEQMRLTTYLDVTGRIECGGSSAGQSHVDQGFVVNEGGGSSSDCDFRVETDLISNAFLIDASAETATFNISTYIASDSKRLYLGAGNDMSIHYDGTDAKIITDLVGASDLIVDCGTEKTIELAEKVWDDQQVNMGSVATSGWFSGAEYADIVEYRSGIAIELQNDASNNYLIRFNAQLSHKYAEGEDIEFHVHVGDNGTGTGNVVLKLTYQWASLEGTYGSSTTVSKTIAIDGTDGKHQVEEIVAAISGSGKGISSILLCTLERDAGNGSDTFSGSLYIIGLDFHIPLDTMGSRQEATK